MIRLTSASPILFSMTTFSAVVDVQKN